MNKIILNQLFLLFKKKNLYLFYILILLILMQIYNVYINQKLENINASYVDGLLKIYGGIGKRDLLPNVIYWILIITILLILTQSNNGIIYGYDIMVLSRSNSKTKWWLSKVISSILIIIIYSLTIIIIAKILSSIVFQKYYSSKYTSIYYPTINLDLFSSLKLEILLGCVFTTGCIAIVTLFQSINLISNNNIKSYIVLIMLSIILCILYQNNCIPRQISPLYYPSLIDLPANIKKIIINIFFNIILAFISTIISTIIINKRDYSVFNN